MKSGEAKRLKELEDESRRPKKGVADLTLDKNFVQEALQGTTGPGATSGMQGVGRFAQHAALSGARGWR